MRLMRLYPKNNYNIEYFRRLTDSEILEIENFKKELIDDGYIYLRASYILDIDYIGDYNSYYELFDKILPHIKENIREESLNKLDI